jgi:hypothetical protein
MFLHLGNDAVIRADEIVAVFDMDNTTVARQSRGFLAHAQKTGEVIDICDDLPKSYIVAEHGGITKVYISSVSSRTIAKRAANARFADTDNNEFSLYINK